MARHRHVANVRTDGLAVVLGPLLRDARILAAALVDVDSGMVLDAWSAPHPSGTAPSGAAPGEPIGAPDLELIGAQHAEVVRSALALLRAWPRPEGPCGPEDDTCEVVLGADGGCQHLMRTVPDPHGDRLALAVVVDGSARVLDRVRKRLRAVAVDALTAGPSMTRRPVRGAWSFALPGPDVPAAAAPLPPPVDLLPDHAEDDAEDRRHDGDPAPDPVPAAVPSGFPQPALSRLDAGQVTLPGPRGPHLRPVRAEHADATDPRRRPVDPHRSPSPPAALPAPPRRSLPGRS